tara:strand:+ start:68 stop:670 length:603 start_codon:yes stop_codon:yes gene_type:complete
MNNWSVEDIYPTPVYLADVDNFDSIQNEIENAISNIEFTYSAGFGNTHKLSHHFHFNKYLMGDLPIFSSELKNHISRYCQQLNFGTKEYQFISSWMTLFEQGDYAHIHNHNDADFSGVYYYQKESDTEDFFFESPVEGARISAPYYGGRIYPPTHTGFLMLFPGWLNHGVDKIKTDGKRYSVSFNIEFQKFNDDFPVNVL